MASTRQITVVGAGLSGLTTAYRLTALLPQAKVTVLEASDRTGGWINSTSHRIDNGDNKSPSGEQVGSGQVILESGPRSIRPRGSRGAPGMLQLIRDLGLQGEMIAIPKSHPSAKNRYLLDSKANTLRPLGLNLFNSAVSPWTILSTFFEPLKRTRSSSITDESVDSFLTRRLGHGVANLASAGMHGIYAASTADLSSKAILGTVYDWEPEYGSVLLGALLSGRGEDAKRQKALEEERWSALGPLGKERDGWAMYGLRGGLETLTKTLTEQIKRRGVELRLKEPVKTVSITSDGVAVTTPSGTIKSNHLVSSIPPSALPSFAPSSSVQPTPRTSVGVATFVFPLPPSSVHPNGFGYLIPRPPPFSNSNPHGILGVVFDSTALPGLDSATGITKLTVMMGGPYWSSYTPTLPFPASSADLVQPALSHLRSVLPALYHVQPLITSTHLHKECIPTYTPGHVDRIRELYDAIGASEWKGKISFVGNGFGGVGVNDCLWSSIQVVDGLAAGQTPTGLEAWIKKD